MKDSMDISVEVILSERSIEDETFGRVAVGLRADDDDGTGQDWPYCVVLQYE